MSSYDTQTHTNQVIRTYAYASSYSNYTFSLDQEQIWNERCAIQRETEKEVMRHEIMMEEIKQPRCLEAEVRREPFMEREMPLMLRQQPLLTHHYPHRLEPEMVHGEMFVQGSRRIVMPETYVVGVGNRGEIGGFEVVPFQRRPPSPSPKIKEITNFDQPKEARIDITNLGKPSDLTVSGVKRKQSTPPLSDAAASSSGVSLHSSKKRLEEWNCAICDVSATSAGGLSDHIAGKKHQAKVATVKDGNRTGVKIGFVKSKTPDMEQPSDSKNKTVGESKKFIRQCKLCKTGPLDDNGWNLHKKGKKHLKSLLNKERAKNRANRKRKYAINVA